MHCVDDEVVQVGSLLLAEVLTQLEELGHEHEECELRFVLHAERLEGLVDATEVFLAKVLEEKVD